VLERYPRPVIRDLKAVAFGADLTDSGSLCPPVAAASAGQIAVHRVRRLAHGASNLRCVRNAG